ncbi:MAG: hypothetical protein JWP11_3408 [Frankiales bacterium]|nr:hypothetical protein [Frankiales bacterium]
MDLDWYALRAWRKYAALSFAVAMLFIPAAREWVAQVALDQGLRRAERLEPVLKEIFTPELPLPTPAAP